MKTGFHLICKIIIEALMVGLPVFLFYESLEVIGVIVQKGSLSDNTCYKYMSKDHHKLSKSTYWHLNSNLIQVLFASGILSLYNVARSFHSVTSTYTLHSVFECYEVQSSSYLHHILTIFRILALAIL